MTRAAVVIALVVSSSIAAPAPKPKPGLSMEQEAQLKSGLEEMETAMVAFSQQRHRLANRGDLTREIEDELKRKRLTLCRMVAEKLSRLDESLTGVGRADRDRVSFLTGIAWRNAGEPAKALECFGRVLGLSADPTQRLHAVKQAIVCYTGLGQDKEIRRLIALARKELPRVSEVTRGDAERWIKVVEMGLGP